MLKLEQSKQNEIITHIAETFDFYKTNTAVWRDRMTAIYKWVSTFTSPKAQPWETNFKINKMHEYENRIVPRIMSKQPEPIVSYIREDMIENEDLDVWQLTEAVEDKLSSIYKKQDMIESLKLRARWWVRYWLCFAKLSPKYRISRKSKKVAETVWYNEDWTPIEKVGKKIEEKVYEQYTGIDIKSFTDIYFDPRCTRLEDMSSIIDISRNIRLSYFTRNPKKFMNLDLLQACCMSQSDLNNIDWYKNRVASLLGINVDKVSLVKPNSLNVKCYYGYYDLSDDKMLANEKLYEFWVVDDTVMVYACEIPFLPFEEFRVFEDTESFLATGFLEPILGLQDEYNWKKNRASEYINRALKPDYIWSPMSWIDPRKVNQGHWNLIVTTTDATTALANLVQMPARDLNNSYFNEQNDIERQFQSATFTINTNSPVTQNSLTNTATWAKIQSFDTDAVLWEVRTNFEQALVRLSYKLLQSEYENTEANMILSKRSDPSTFREIHKEAIADVVEKYEIVIEAGSSSYDSQESRRNDALAQRNIAIQWQQAGLWPNIKKQYENVMMTFPNQKSEEIFSAMPQPQVQPWQMEPLPLEPTKTQ